MIVCGSGIKAGKPPHVTRHPHPHTPHPNIPSPYVDCGGCYHCGQLQVLTQGRVEAAGYSDAIGGPDMEQVCSPPQLQNIHTYSTNIDKTYMVLLQNLHGPTTKPTRSKYATYTVQVHNLHGPSTKPTRSKYKTYTVQVQTYMVQVQTYTVKA